MSFSERGEAPNTELEAALHDLQAAEARVTKILGRFQPIGSYPPDQRLRLVDAVKLQ